MDGNDIYALTDEALAYFTLDDIQQADIEDARQDAAVAILTSAKQAENRGKRPARAYLIASAKRAIARSIAQEPASEPLRDEHTDEVTGEMADPPRSMAKSEITREVAKALDANRRKPWARVLRMRFIDGKRLCDIADAMRISTATAHRLELEGFQAMRDAIPAHVYEAWALHD